MLTDLVMPGMSGTDLARKSLMLRPKLPILFMTAFADEEAVHLSVWNDTVRPLTKPFTADVLLGKICEVLGAKPFSGTAARASLRCRSLVLDRWTTAMRCALVLIRSRSQKTPGPCHALNPI